MSDQLMCNRVEKEIEDTLVDSSAGFLTADSRSIHNNAEVEDGKYFSVMAELLNARKKERKKLNEFHIDPFKARKVGLEQFFPCYNLYQSSKKTGALFACTLACICIFHFQRQGNTNFKINVSSSKVFQVQLLHRKPFFS